MTGSRDLLRAQLDRDARSTQTLAGRIARWLSSDFRTLGPLRLELERCRFNHRHEMSRLRTLIDGGLRVHGDPS